MNISFSPRQHMGSTNLSFDSNTNSPKNALNINNKSKNHIKKNGMCLSLGKKSKRNNILENLLKQKEHLMDNKNTIMERSLKKGEDPKSIKQKLETIDKQIEEIDKQLNEIKLEEQRKGIGVKDKNKKNKNTKEKSNKNSINNTKTDPAMDNLLNLSTGLTKTKALSSERNLMSGNAKVLDCEIKTDEKRGLDPVRKKKHLSEMKHRIEDITKKLSNHLKDVNTKTIKNSQNNFSNDIVKKNKQIKDENINLNQKTENKSLIEQQRVAQNIKHYKDNMKNNTKDNCEKINIIA